jgi:hypothetical protein
VLRPRSMFSGGSNSADTCRRRPARPWCCGRSKRVEDVSCRVVGDPHQQDRWWLTARRLREAVELRSQNLAMAKRIIRTDFPQFRLNYAFRVWSALHR